ncbi:MAG: SHOCT domain-containing protein [Acidimicrobiales bacterium]
MFAAEFGVGQVLWSIFWFFLFFIWIMLVFQVFGDIIRSEMSGMSKALWAAFIIFVPYLGIFMYLIVNGSAMGERNVQRAQEQDAAVQQYIRSAAGSASASDQLASLADLHSSGKLSDEEYAAAKSRVINS